MSLYLAGTLSSIVFNKISVLNGRTPVPASAPSITIFFVNKDPASRAISTALNLCSSPYFCSRHNYRHHCPSADRVGDASAVASLFTTVYEQTENSGYRVGI